MKPHATVRRTGSAALAGLLLATGLVTASGGGTATAAVPTWSAPLDLSAVGANASDPQVAVSADGTKATAVWARLDSGKTIIQSASATISGNSATWSGVTDLSAPGQNADQAQIALTGDGRTATAIWRRFDGSKTIIQTASAAITGNTADWSTVTDLSAPGQNARFPKVAMAANATLATAVWSRYDVSSFEIIQSASATISGKAASWSAVADVSAGGGYAQIPEVAVSANGTRATATWYRAPNSGNYVAQTASATISGNTADWSAVTTLAATDRNSYDTQIRVSADGSRATALWYYNVGGTTWVVQAASATVVGKDASWSGTTTISGTETASPQLALSSDGTIAVAIWRRLGATESATAVISGASASWSSPIVVGGSWNGPRVALSGDGTKAVVIGDVGFDQVIQTAAGAISGGTATWSTPEALSATGGNPNTPQVAMSSNGATTVAVWARSNGSNRIIQSATRATPPRCTVAPTSPQVSAGPDGATLSFTAVPSGCEADQFQVRCMPLGVAFNTGPNADVRYATTPTLPVLVGRLTSGRTYHCMVREQVTGASPYEGPLSAWSNDIAVSYTTPAAPTSASAERVASQTVRVSFTPPSDGGATITDYDAQYSTSPTFASGVTFSESGTTTGSSIDISGLTNGTTYYFRVRASNLAGNGPWSAITNGAKPYTTPGTPTKVAAQRLTGPTSQQTVRVSFTAPGTGGSAITDYDVQYSPDPTFATGVVFFEGGTTTGSSVDVTGLTNGTTYYFQVRASNLAGDGPWSATSNGVKP
ncbi:MAG: fibronectin type III domain-containing protein [Actinomycetota bacterium]